LPLFFVPLNTLAYTGLPPGKSNNASALLNLMRMLGGGVGISIAVTILERRTQFHQERLGSHWTPFDPAYLERFHAIVAKFLSQGMSAADATIRALAAMYQSLQAQALMLAYIDVFKIMAIGCLGVIVLVMFLKRIDLSHKAEAVGH
jgi:DHA2 family multidrug resistance protein